MNPSPHSLPFTPADAYAIQGASLGVSITNERGECYRYHANAVSLRMKRGSVQIVERDSGCFVWFKRCNLEIRDRRRHVLFRLLAGSAHNDGSDLTIIAEIARPRGNPPPIAAAKSGPVRFPLKGKSNTRPTCPPGPRF